MKKIFILFYGLILFAVLANAQNDSVYFMKSGSIILRQSIKEADLDSIIFYNPFDKMVTVIDIDGNEYKTVKIGNQIWMAENLRTTHYRNGDEITTTDPSNKDIAGETEPKYQWIYNRYIPQFIPYGRLYTWYAATDSRGVAPEGWHVATKKEWEELTEYLITNGYNYDGTTSGNKVGKSLASKTLWNNNGSEGVIGNDLSKNNSTGFNAFPGGYRAQDGFGNAYHNLGNCTQLWCWDEFDNQHAYSEHLGFDRVDLLLGTTNWKHLGFAIRCIKNEISCPALTTISISNVGQLTATSGGNISSDGGETVTVRGVCWSLNPTPTIADSITKDGTGMGEFESSLTGLLPDTTYYVRAYATNSVGTCYGDEIIFKTKDYVVENCGTVTDIDGNVYQTVKIGNQCWMAENLKTTKYRNGDAIANVTGSSEWAALTTGAWCVYNNNASYASTYGLLYNWYAVGDTRGLAPQGWHVASTEEWQTMANYLIANGYNYDGSTYGNKIGKAVATGENWISNSYPGGVGNNQSSNNKSGLSIPPGGGRQHTTGDYFVMNYHSNLYTSTEVDATNARQIGVYFDADYLMLGLEGIGAPKYLGASVRCVRNTEPNINCPTLITTSVTNVTSVNAISGGNITSDGGAEVTARGICWSTNPNPTITDTKTMDGTGIGEFTSSITGLTANTTYYLRAYATNSVGTCYGIEISFKTYNSETVTDVDGNVYHTVIIGKQTWMVENLKTTKYRNGDTITNVKNNTAWQALNTGAWCDYKNDVSNGTKYGHLYNWYTINDSRNIAPVGWHVPSDSEWSTLENYVSTHLGASSSIAKALAASTGWPEEAIIGQNILNNNSTGFTGLPAGNIDANGGFWNIGSTCFWWSSTENNNEEASTRNIYYINNEVLKGYYGKRFGLSIRCIKNEIACPALATISISNVGQLTTTSGGNITFDGESEVTVRGVCWSLKPNPTIIDSITMDGTGTGEYTSSLTGLLPDTTYYVRAYATNSVGTCYGNEISFKTEDYVVENCGTVTDIDGNVYQTVKIGDQCWMAENLKASHYRNGDEISNVTDGTIWATLNTGAWCDYENNLSNGTKYGHLYNWYAVNDTRIIAPAGWHVPSDAEWIILHNYLINNGYNYDGSTSDNKIAKSLASKTDWNTSTNIGAIGNDLTINNSSGFTALPGGYRNGSGVFGTIGDFGFWWSATVFDLNGAWYRSVYSYENFVNVGSYPMIGGFSVRCVRD